MIKTDDEKCLKIYEHYQDENTNSMEDMHQVDLETRMIMKHIPRDRMITLLDCGCGEGISTEQYSKLPNVEVIGIDASETRIKMAKKRCPGIKFVCEDIMCLKDFNKYDIIISQRFLSNMPTWDRQKLAVNMMFNFLRSYKSRLILMEGSIQGHNEMNYLKGLLGLSPNSIKWYNNFIDDNVLEECISEEYGMSTRLITKEGLGAYILLTRCVRPFFDKELNWDCEFNKVAASDALNDFFKTDKFSRIKMWVYEKS